MKVLENPLHNNTYRLIAKEYPYVLPTIAIGVEANIISITPFTPLFQGIDFFECKEDEEKVNIAPPLTGPSLERIQELSDHFKPLTGEDLPKGDINTVLTFLFNKMKIPIEAQPGKPVVLKLRQLSDTLAIRFLGKSPNYFGTKTPTSYYNWYSTLNPNEWEMCCVTTMLQGGLNFCGIRRRWPLKHDPIPSRDVAYPEVAREMCNFFDQSGEFPNFLRNLPAPKDEMLFSVLKQMVHSEATIGEMVHAEAALSEIVDSEVARNGKVHSETGFNGVVHCQATLSEMIHSQAIDTSQAAVYTTLATIYINQAASRALTEKFRDDRRQLNAELGYQTSAYEGDASDDLGTSPQGPQQCVHCGRPFEQCRHAQEAHETVDMGSNTSVATGYANAGATTRPAFSNPDEEHTEGREEAPAETETGLACCNHGKLVESIIFLIKILLLLGYVLCLDFEVF